MNQPNNNKKKKNNNKKKKKINPAKMMNQSQRQALMEVINDLNTTKGRNNRKHRILYGEVGAGKTLVAMAAALYVEQKLGGQTAIMCPTASLAKQHHRTINEIKGRTPSDHTHGDVALITAKQNARDKEINREVRAAQRKSGIVIGTHALANVNFKNLRLVIIDEQQKFGTKVRQLLTEKLKPRGGGVTIFLTATPIPRTIGQLVMEQEDHKLEISAIDPRDEMKKKITTSVMYDPKSRKTINTIRGKVNRNSVLNKGISLLIAPAISKGKHDLIDCEWLFEKITEKNKSSRGGVPKKLVRILHGKLPPEEKQKILDETLRGKVTVLVTTSIVEVGMHIPGCNLAAIFQCDRFGMAQIHQMRGRVGRVKDKHLPPAECILVSPKKSKCSDKARRKNKAVTEGDGKNTGIELAIQDAIIRGPGEAAGNLQHGYTEKDSGLHPDDDATKGNEEEEEGDSDTEPFP